MLAYGIAMVVLALVAFLWPFSATLATTLVAGIMFVVAGVASLIAAARHRGERRGYDIVSGVLGLLVGLYLLVFPLSGAITLTFVLAVFFGARGLSELYWGFRRASRRGWLILLGVVNLGLMVLILVTLPGSALVLPGTLMAISFLFTGMAAIAGALAARTA